MGEVKREGDKGVTSSSQKQVEPHALTRFQPLTSGMGIARKRRERKQAGKIANKSTLGSFFNNNKNGVSFQSIEEQKNHTQFWLQFYLKN